MTIQEVSERTGLTGHTLRYYERVELIPPIDRDGGGRRCYSEQDLGWIDFVKKLRNTGMSISNIRRYMKLAVEGDHTVDERLRLLAEHRRYVEGALAELQDNLAALNWKIAFYESVAAQMANSKTQA